MYVNPLYVSRFSFYGQISHGSKLPDECGPGAALTIGDEVAITVVMLLKSNGKRQKKHPKFF